MKYRIARNSSKQLLVYNYNSRWYYCIAGKYLTLPNVSKVASALFYVERLTRAAASGEMRRQRLAERMTTPRKEKVEKLHFVVGLALCAL